MISLFFIFFFRISSIYSSSDEESTDESVNEEDFSHPIDDGFLQNDLSSGAGDENFEEKLDIVNSKIDEVLIEIDEYFEKGKITSSTFLVRNLFF